MRDEIAYAPMVQIKNFQEDQLQKLIAYLDAHSPYYKRLFSAERIKPSDIKTIEDLAKIPTTTKEDLQQHNSDFLCVPSETIIDYVTTSGTLGEPVTIALNDSDLDRLAYNEALSFACSGMKQQDIIQLMTTMDRRFMAGLAYFLGARKLGAGIVRVGSGVPELQWDSILKFNPSYLIAVPSFLLKLIEYADQHGIDLGSCSVKAAICIGEPIREQDFSLNTLAQKITSRWDIELFSTYASTEMSTAFNECEAHNGGHQHPELIITEILDEHQKPVQEGTPGELVVTTLGVKAMPLLRFRTGDIVKSYSNPCSCGRNTQRLGPVMGRKKHMIKYKGTTIYPPAMYNILSHFDGVESYVIEITQNELGTDEILIRIAVKEETSHLLDEIKDHFRAKLRVRPMLEICDSKVIERLRESESSRKPRNLIDRRHT